MMGPASRAPEVGKAEEAGDESDAEPSDCELSAAAHAHVDVAEASIAVDPVHNAKPVQMMQALQANLEAMQSHASKIIRNEKSAKIEDSSGILQPVADEGGRQCLQSLTLDVQSAASSF